MECNSAVHLPALHNQGITPESQVTQYRRTETLPRVPEFQSLSRVCITWNLHYLVSHTNMRWEIRIILPVVYWTTNPHPGLDIWRTVVGTSRLCVCLVFIREAEGFLVTSHCKLLFLPQLETGGWGGREWFLPENV